MELGRYDSDGSALELIVVTEQLHRLIVHILTNDSAKK